MWVLLTHIDEFNNFREDMVEAMNKVTELVPGVVKPGESNLSAKGICGFSNQGEFALKCLKKFDENLSLAKENMSKEFAKTTASNCEVFV